MDTNFHDSAKLDVLIRALETMFKTQDKIHEERHYSNHRAVWKLQEETYDPARDQFKQILLEMIDDAVEKRLENLKINNH